MGNHQETYPKLIGLDSITSVITSQLEQAITALPQGFHDSFDYTRTGNNICHSVTLWILGDAVARVDGVAYVGIDVNLNRGKCRCQGKSIKFQPDVVGFRKDGSHALYVDFESPNSCDTRLVVKNIRPYLVWKNSGETAPYIIVTSLPDKCSQKWQLRWKKYFSNSEHSETEIRKNPFRYWYTVWNSDLARVDLSQVVFLNIDGRSVRRIKIGS